MFAYALILLIGNQFTLRVKNEAGDNEFTYEIVAYLPPIFKNATQNQTTIINAIEGMAVHLDCDVDGLPAPNVCILPFSPSVELNSFRISFYFQISWIHNNKTISKNLSLLMEKVRVTDQGDYNCTANNEYGNATKIFSLNVLGKGHPKNNCFLLMNLRNFIVEFSSFLILKLSQNL